MYVGIGAATGNVYNVTLTNSSTSDIGFRNSTWPNGSSEIVCDNFAVSNASELGVNATSNAYRCVGNESSNVSVKRYVSGSVGTVFVLCVTICLGVWSAVANGLPLAAIVKQEQLHIPAYILMANLAASDVLAGVVFVLSGSTVLYSSVTGAVSSPIVSRLRFTAIILSGLSSAYSLMALTAERFWFIVYGMTYVNNVTNDRCKVVIMIVWVWSVLLAILPYFDWECAGQSDHACLPLVFVFIPMAAIFLSNMGILWCLWKHVNAIAAQEAAVGAQPTTSRKSAVTIVILTAVFLVGWLPFFSRMALLTKDVRSLHSSMIFVILNSSINPVIYGFRLKEVRRGVVRLFTSNSSNEPEN
ncbi:melanocortin receptor 5-like [Branchiostoma floridae x Branchiostoma belcheri]